VKRVVLALALLLLIPRPGDAAAPKQPPVPLSEKIKQKQQLIEATRHKLQQKRGQLHQARYKVQTISSQLDDTNGAITRVTSALGDLDGQIALTEKRLAVRQGQLAATRASLDRHTGALDRRMVDMYERGATSYLDVLLSATSFDDFIERWDFLTMVVRADTALISRIDAEEQRYRKIVADLTQTQADLNAQRQDQETKRGQLAQLADRRRELLYAAQVQRNQIAEQVNQLEELTAAEEARLQDLIREQERQAQEAIRRAKLAAWQARRAAAIAAGLPVPKEPLEGSGHFIWPVNGPVVSGFGMRWHPILGGYRMHTGIDIAASYGDPIVASDDGTVIMADWYGGYGEAIVVAHGNGLSTLYAHCSSMLVSKGMNVQRGQLIGRVGATGYATGPHLHFEIRVNGVPVNPLSRL